MISNEDLYRTETGDPATQGWPYSATLSGTRLTLYSQRSVEDAIGHVQRAMIEAFTGSYAPIVLSYRHKMIILSRDVLSRIAIDVMDVPGAGVTLTHLPHQISGYTEWADAVKDAWFLLAQLTWNGEEEESEVLAGYAQEQEPFARWAREEKAKRDR